MGSARKGLPQSSNPPAEIHARVLGTAELLKNLFDGLLVAAELKLDPLEVCEKTSLVAVLLPSPLALLLPLHSGRFGPVR